MSSPKIIMLTLQLDGTLITEDDPNDKYKNLNIEYLMEDNNYDYIFIGYIGAPNKINEMKQKMTTNKKYNIKHISSFTLCLINISATSQDMYLHLTHVEKYHENTNELVLYDQGHNKYNIYTDVKYPSLIVCHFHSFCAICNGDISLDINLSKDYTFKKVYETNKTIIYIMDHRKHLVKKAIK